MASTSYSDFLFFSENSLCLTAPLIMGALFSCGTYDVLGTQTACPLYQGADIRCGRQVTGAVDTA